MRPPLATRPAGALLAAGACGAAMLLIWAATFHVAAITRLDGHAMEGFAELHDALGHISGPIVHAFGTLPFAAACAVLVGTALLRRRPYQAAAAAVALVGANASGRVLKAALAEPRGFDIDADSWPSGHATAAMSLALCLVLVAPVRWRPVAGAIAAVFALTVGVAIMITGGHFSSDVLAGFLLAALWMGLAVAGMRALRAPAPAPDGGSRPSARDILRPTAIALAAIAGLALLLAVVRAAAVIDHVEEHPAVILGALAVAVAPIALAAAASVALTRNGPDTR